MSDFLSLLSPEPAQLAALAHHINCTALLYTAAAFVARFWHKHLWMVYIAMAYTTILGLNH